MRTKSAWLQVLLLLLVKMIQVTLIFITSNTVPCYYSLLCQQSPNIYIYDY